MTPVPGRPARAAPVQPPTEKGMPRGPGAVRVPDMFIFHQLYG
ncbi:Hypothetical protein SCLAV_p0638 (plasmid) [Streptomyces clavuligerus]|uniref:Uncharacterized protein n=1 Tax=Streptomyces clavuligerus TaxID=1901 RepID=B5GTQ9_STRCL|nr:hypothetical protein SSCG_02807 [Streptomyces clavuligerus]EFG04125.1 Hypothetical protein SCLAV_p0638 [Streptomyces clavuligerus]